MQGRRLPAARKSSGEAIIKMYNTSLLSMEFFRLPLISIEKINKADEIFLIDIDLEFIYPIFRIT